MNASPLIFLTKVGLLEVLHQQAVPVLVPDVVMAEISSLGLGDPAVQAVQQAGWIRVVPAPPAPPSVTSWKLDDGESSVIAGTKRGRVSFSSSGAFLCGRPPERWVDSLDATRKRLPSPFLR